jgi:hypothetical protein
MSIEVDVPEKILRRKKMMRELKKWGLLLEAIMVASTLTAMMVAPGSAQVEAGGLNETAFWAFFTIAVTVIVSVLIAGIFHYLSTRELRKMGTEMAVEMGRMGGGVHEGASEAIKTTSEQIQRRIAEDGEQTRGTIVEKER